MSCLVSSWFPAGVKERLRNQGSAAVAESIGARVLWLQEDVVSPSAEQIAVDAGLLFVMDTCIKKMHAKYIGD